MAKEVDADLPVLLHLRAQLCVELPNSGRVVHWHDYPVSLPLVLCRKHQQDAMRANWEGLVAGTDDSVDERSEHIRARYAVGEKPIPESQSRLSNSPVDIY